MVEELFKERETMVKRFKLSVEDELGFEKLVTLGNGGFSPEQLPMPKISILLPYGFTPHLQKKKIVKNLKLMMKKKMKPKKVKRVKN